MTDGMLLRAVGLVALLAVASVLWLLVTRRRGRLRAAPSAGSALRLDTLARAEAVPEAGERLTVVQLSAPVCSSRRSSEARWREFAARSPGVRVHVHLAEEHPDVVDRLAIRTAPTSLVFGADRTLAGLVPGVPTSEQLRELAAAGAAVKRSSGQDS